MQTFPKIKVEFMPYRESIKAMPETEKKTLGLILNSGKINEYRKTFIEGLGASIKDKSWNRKKHWHRCCKSTVPWRHLKTCPKLCRNAPDDLSDLKDLN
jgi:hypothetical protein